MYGGSSPGKYVAFIIIYICMEAASLMVHWNFGAWVLNQEWGTIYYSMLMHVRTFLSLGVWVCRDWRGSSCPIRARLMWSTSTPSLGIPLCSMPPSSSPKWWSRVSLPHLMWCSWPEPPGQCTTHFIFTLQWARLTIGWVQWEGISAINVHEVICLQVCVQWFTLKDWGAWDLAILTCV